MLVVCAALSLGWAAGTHGAASAPGYRVAATISASQVPRLRYLPPKGNVAKARGSFVETVNPSSASGSWKLTFTGTTGVVKEARVVYWSTGGGTVVANNHELCSGIYMGVGPRPRGCRSGATGVDHWPTLRYAQAFLAAVKRGKAWVVLFTARNPDPNPEAAGVLKLAK